MANVTGFVTLQSHGYGVTMNINISLKTSAKLRSRAKVG